MKPTDVIIYNNNFGQIYANTYWGNGVNVIIEQK